ncbi:hypothetical protein I540_0386 [Mycobacteroides abscessus subsp. bolletii 1513]|uniref:Uncharacterized protein n=1 Tax=Mycobacteroides abscessus subsp. bolletii 1513 TaxID=1299321 RepID=X8E280_9MYCO|nr:hypothetical protein I540_0386 [Mycobacteroides abscessus subsp. bolletii 1513]
MRCKGLDVTGADRRARGNAETTRGSLALRWVESSRSIRDEGPRPTPAMPKTRRAESGQPGQGTASGAVANGKLHETSPQLVHRY